MVAVSGREVSLWRYSGLVFQGGQSDSTIFLKFPEELSDMAGENNIKATA